MKKLNLAVSVALLVSGSAAFADILNSGNSAATGTAFNPSGAFWNNTSGDVVNGITAANVGNFLGDTGGFALNGNVTANCSDCGINYETGGGKMFVNSGNTPDYVSSLNFVRQAGALQISLLYANSSENSLAEFGIYDATNPYYNHLILQQNGVNLNNMIGTQYTSGTQYANNTNLGTVSLANGSPYATWGLYVRTCVGQETSVATCASDGNLVTYFMGAASQLNAGQTPYDSAHQHFALFQAGSNVNQYYAGLEDYAFNAANPTNPTEGYGDYNDIIFGITSSISGVPEPTTISIVGLGLVGLGFFGRRFKK